MIPTPAPMPYKQIDITQSDGKMMQYIVMSPPDEYGCLLVPCDGLDYSVKDDCVEVVTYHSGSSLKVKRHYHPLHAVIRIDVD